MDGLGGLVPTVLSLQELEIVMLFYWCVQVLQ